MKIKFIALAVIFFCSVSYSQYTQIFLDADSTGDAYDRIVSKGYGYEVPDCNHPVRHIVEEWNEELQKYVLKFTLHKDEDNDRCINFDRQRCEIKTYGSSPKNMQGQEGETHTYRWKFKLDSLFQPSPKFCHIHQLKAGDGPDAGMPLITITPRYGSPNKLQLIFNAPTGWSGSGTLKQVNLAPFLGEWIEAYETVKYDTNGTYNLVLRRVRDDAVLFSFSSSKIAMWRIGSTFIRPKYGIYRSLDSPTYLRDEDVLFADFYLAEGDTADFPLAPDNLEVTELSGNKNKLKWNDNSDNEILFRIDRSADSLDWQYLAEVSKNRTDFIDSNLTSSAKYFYRIRAENTFGNSWYSNIAGTSLSAIYSNKDIPLPKNFFIKNYPNPFNPNTTIIYSIPVESKVVLKIYDINGKEISTLLDKFEDGGIHKVNWNGKNKNGGEIVSGIYFAKISAGRFFKTIKLLLLK